MLENKGIYCRAVRGGGVIIGGAALLVCILLSDVACFAQEGFVYDAKGKRDPFISLITPEGMILKFDTVKKKGALNLTGIIFDKNGVSYALVNGLVVKIGDTVEDYQVLKITDDRVVFIKEGQLTEIELKKEEK